MKQYYYSDGTKKVGPFSLEELKKQNITRDTPVWCHPMPKWKAAGEIPDLEELFGTVPPDLNNEEPKQDRKQENYASRPPMPKTWLVESILATLFCCLPFGIIGIVYAARVESSYSRGDYQTAERSSKEAGRWTKLSIFLALALYILIFILIATGVTISLLDF
jgi:hypothetical protein